MSHAYTVNSLVAFRNSQGVEARGTLLKLTRSTLIFEVYNPYSIIQLSEVLQDVSIRRGERVIYRGRAVVSNLVNTGLMLIVSATLLDPWSDLASVLTSGDSLEEEIQAFVADWEGASHLRPGYQLAVSRIRSFLSELNRWLDQLEVSRDDRDGQSRALLSTDMFNKLVQPLLPKLHELFQQFEAEVVQVPDDELVMHKHFVQHNLHPLMLRAPFVHRAYYKPLGYAGDYEMVNMMLREPREGPTVYAQLVNTLFLSSGPAAAHRNRIEILTKRLAELAESIGPLGRPLRILNIGCGPAVEIQRFVRMQPIAGRCEFHLLDFNEETLAYARRQIQLAGEESGTSPEIRFIHESVHALLKQASQRDGGDNQDRYDLVYCAGLFDYLSDRVCTRLLRLFHQWVRPGGLVLATNVHPGNEIRGAMEHIAEWHLIYRSEKEMADLAPQGPPHQVYLDETGVNAFLEIRKPE